MKVVSTLGINTHEKKTK